MLETFAAKTGVVLPTRKFFIISGALGQLTFRSTIHTPQEQEMGCHYSADLGPCSSRHLVDVSNDQIQHRPSSATSIISVSEPIKMESSDSED